MENIMNYQENIRYPLSELANISEWWQTNQDYDINEYEDYVVIKKRTDEQIAKLQISELKAELAKIKEDIEQEVFGLVRDDYAEKKVRAAQIINELRRLEGKSQREIKESLDNEDNNS